MAKGDLPRSTINAIAAFFASAGAQTIERFEVDEGSWTAAYKLEIPNGATWAAIGAVMESMGDSDTLTKDVGKRRGCQVIAEFSLEEARGRRKNTEYASLSMAEGFKASCYQAASKAAEYQQRYKNARVFTVILYFR